MRLDHAKISIIPRVKKKGQELHPQLKLCQKMETPRILRVLNKSLIIAVAVSILSFIFPIIPCKTAPVVAEPVYAWSLCKLPNPFGEQLIGLSIKYWATAASPLSGLVLEFLIVFVLFTIIFLLFRRKAAKVLDLTRRG